MTNLTTNLNALSSANDKIVAVTQKSIGGTIYYVESQISDSARETAYDKVKRLILSSTTPEQLKSA